MGISYAGLDNWEIAGMSTAPNHDQKRLCVRRRNGEDYHYKKTPLQKNYATGMWEHANTTAGGCTIPEFLPESPNARQPPAPKRNSNSMQEGRKNNAANHKPGAWQRIVRAIGSGKDRMDAVGRAHNLGHTTEAMRILLGDKSVDYRNYLPMRKGPYAGQHPARIPKRKASQKISQEAGGRPLRRREEGPPSPSKNNKNQKNNNRPSPHQTPKRKDPSPTLGNAINSILDKDPELKLLAKMIRDG